LFFTLKFGSSKKDDIDSFSITWQKYYGALRTFMQNNPTITAGRRNFWKLGISAGWRYCSRSDLGSSQEPVHWGTCTERNLGEAVNGRPPA